MNYIKLIIMCLLMVVSLTTQAGQTIKVKDGATVKINISSNELNRMAVKGEMRLGKVWSKKNMLEIQPDKERGEVYIKPTSLAPKVISMFVRDETGATYTVIATQLDLPAQTIIFEPEYKAKLSTEEEKKYKALPLVKKIKKLMKGMALQKDIPGYKEKKTSVVVPLWNQTNIKLIRLYEGRSLKGEVYSIRNVTETTMKFHEREFLDFGSQVTAVALDQLTLNPNETGYLFIVRKAGVK